MTKAEKLPTCRRCKRKRNLKEETEDELRLKTCNVCRIKERVAKLARKRGLRPTDIINEMNDIEQFHAISIENQIGLAMKQNRMMSQLLTTNNAYLEPKPEIDEKFVPRVPAPVLPKLEDTDGEEKFVVKSDEQADQKQEIEIEQPEDFKPAIPIIYCTLCKNPRFVANQSAPVSNSYEICARCLKTPFRNPNMFSNFSDFLEEVSTNRFQDIDPIIFASHDITYSEASPLSKTVTSLENKYIRKIVEACGYKFFRSHSNVGNYQKASPAPLLKLQYQCKQDMNSSSTCLNYKNENCDSQIILVFEISSGELTIKFNHKNHTSIIQQIYSQELIDLVNAMIHFENKSLTEIFEALKHYKLDKNVSHSFRKDISSLDKKAFLSNFNIS